MVWMLFWESVVNYSKILRLSTFPEVVSQKQRCPPGAYSAPKVLRFQEILDKISINLLVLTQMFLLALPVRDMVKMQ